MATQKEDMEDDVELGSEQEPHSRDDEPEDNGVQATDDPERPYVVKTDAPNRRERRRAEAERRSREMIDSAMRPLMEEIAQLRRQQVQPVFVPPPQSQRGGDDPSDFDSQYDSIEVEKSDVIKLLSAEEDPAKAESLRKRWSKLDRKQKELVSEATYKRLNQPRQQVSREEQQRRSVVDYKANILRAEFPEVWANQAALNAATSKYQYEAALARHEGRPEPSLDDERRILKEVSEAFGVQQQGTLSSQKTNRQKFGAVSSRPSAAPTNANGWTPTSAERQYAKMMYPNLPEPQALRKWWDEVGKTAYGHQ